jgi:Sec-independent protein translocase protein TatA
VFGLSFSELAIAALVAFILFGPEQFPVMVKQAIKWVSQIKGYIYEAQMGIKDLTQDIEKELSPLTENIKSEFNPKAWTSSFGPEGVKSSKTSASVERIRLDMKPGSYTDIIDWKKTISLDLDPSHYTKIYSQTTAPSDEPKEQNSLSS